MESDTVSVRLGHSAAFALAFPEVQTYAIQCEVFCKIRGGAEPWELLGGIYLETATVAFSKDRDVMPAFRSRIETEDTVSKDERALHFHCKV